MNQYTAHPVKPEIRFWSHVAIGAEDECWEWQGYCNKDGYGLVGIKKKVEGTHRVAYRFTYGDIPDGLIVLHSCDNPPCCNPKHLSIGTHKNNADDKVSKGRCASLPGESNPGHKLTPAQVEYIRHRYAQDGIGWLRLAREVGISKRQVGRIIKGESWK